MLIRKTLNAKMNDTDKKWVCAFDSSYSKLVFPINLQRRFPFVESSRSQGEHEKRK